MLRSLFTATAILLHLVVSCEGSGSVVVTLKSYRNPSHRTYKNRCCDIRLFSCSPGCDAYFKLCVTHSSSSSDHNCNLGESKTGVVGRRDNHQNINIQKRFTFTSFQGNVNLKVEVWDEDRGPTGDDLIEILRKSIEPFETSRNHYKELVTLSRRRVTVQLELEVNCDMDYYGPKCIVMCVPRDDSSGHYTCDDQGSKVCRKHWYGKSCTHSCVPRDDWGGHYTCDSQGRKVCRRHWYGKSCTRSCVPRDDPRNGHYNCDKEGNKICLPRWEGSSCNRCVKNWFGSRCSTFCVPQDSDEKGHYRCRPSDGKKDCLPWWFGAECKAHCIPHDDVDNGHYNCAHDGSKTCFEGWFGENCTVFCVPQNDDQRGHYTCDNEGNKVCFDGYRPPDCIDCLLGRYGANCSLTCLGNDTSGNDTSIIQQGYFYCTEDGYKNCNRWWHGPECLQYCVPHDDSLHGHYTCNEHDGSKVCRPGWVGPSCLDRKQN